MRLMMRRSVLTLLPMSAALAGKALGGSYTASGMSPATSVSMAPTTGLILLKTPGS